MKRNALEAQQEEDARHAKLKKKAEPQPEPEPEPESTEDD